MALKLTKPPLLREKKDFGAFNNWTNSLFEWSKELSLNFDDSKYLLRNGARTLGGNWDAGDFDIQAKTFTSDVGTGTAPLNINSTTLVANLNADLWDGYQFADYLNQAVKTTSSPAFANITDNGLTASSLVWANASKVLASVTVGNSLSFSAGALDAIQDIRTSASPTFAGLTISTTGELNLRDGDIGFNSSADGYLDIFADGRVNITTPYIVTTQGTLPAAQGYGELRTLTFNTPNPVGARSGIYYEFTTAGTANARQQGLFFEMKAGYTGAHSAIGIYFANAAQATGNNINTWMGNYGSMNYVYGVTTGLNCAQGGWAQGGNLNIGVMGEAPTAKNSATNLGVLGIALNTGTSPVQIGGYFTLRDTATPNIPSVSAALIADNGSQTSNILRLFDNGTACFAVEDGGTVYAQNIYPWANDTYYLGKNSISSPYAWKGVCVKDTTNGNYYRIEVISGTLTATQIT